MSHRPFVVSAMLVAHALVAGCSADVPDPIPEKRVTIYPAVGYFRDSEWIVPMRIWVHEAPDAARRLIAGTARDELLERAGITEYGDGDNERFMFRVDGFIADSESNEIVVFEFDGDVEGRAYQLRDADGQTNTDRNGLIEGNLRLTADDATRLQSVQNSTDGWLTLRVVSADHGGVGRIRLISPTGMSVISDIDDTIKVTDIPAGEVEIIRNTFFRDFKAAPCMAQMYRNLGADVAFHYVSGGPWQMYQPLADFLLGPDARFPPGSFHMKNVRTNLSESESYVDIWKLVAGGSQAVTFEQKVGQIATLLEQYPERRFLLIGDSGERDPEVFAEIRRRFPERIDSIRIRDVVDAEQSDPARVQGMIIIRPDPAADCSDVM